MQRFDAMLELALAPQKQYLTDVERGIYQRGKKLRPIMLMLSAAMVTDGQPLPDKVIKAAVSLEMLHVATLIHDDIIDNALLRRGLESVNSTRGTNAAILIGDMQFVQAIRTFIDAIETDREMELAKIVLDTAFNICAGELDELSTDPLENTQTLRERYLSVIERKTAIMFGLACETGVGIVEGHTSDARRVGFYGRRVGMAFQIMDDLFDLLQDEKHSGKQLGIDILQGRITLPIIYAMESLGPDHRLSKIVRKQIPPSESVRAEVEAILATDAIDRAYSDARIQALEALEYLKIFPKNNYRDALEQIALYTINREI